MNSMNSKNSKPVKAIFNGILNIQCSMEYLQYSMEYLE